MNRKQTHLDPRSRPRRLSDAVKKCLYEQGGTNPYELIFEKHPDPMWVVDAETFEFVLVNQAAIREYQYTKEEFLKMSLFDIRPPDTIDQLKDYTDKMSSAPLSANKGTCDRWFHQRKDGSQMEVEVTWRPLMINERPCVISAIALVTEPSRISARMALQTRALSKVNDAVFSIDNTRRISYWSEGAVRLYGHSAEEALGRPIGEIVAYRYQSPEEEKQAHRHLKERGYWRGEKLHYKKDGTPFYVDNSLTTLKNNEGAVIGLLAVVRDISERKRFQRELVEKNHMLNAMIASSPVAIIVHDREGKIDLWNQAAEQIFGWTAEEMCGRSYSRIVPAEHLEEHLSFHQEALKGHTIDGVEIQRRTKSGLLVDLRASAAPIRAQDGSVLGVIALLADIGQQKRTERALRSAKEEADEANRTKSEFVANISHEIRTPLSAILGFAEMMFDAKQTVSERMKCISRIRHNVNNLTHLIDDLLDLSRVEAGHFQVERTYFSLLSELAEVTSNLKSQGLRKRLGLQVFFEGPIPKLVHSDPSRLRQILYNVLGNAIKFTNRGTINLFISLKDVPESSSKIKSLSFRVEDTGLGIPESERERIFQPFAQIDSSATREFGGTGLGLNLSRRLAKRLGGDVILLRSTPNKGSVFEVTIDPGPIEPSNLLKNVTQNDLVSRQSAPLSSYRSNLSGMRVLLVEDGQDNQFLLSHFLSSSGAVVDIASNGKEGLNLTDQNTYDLILMDIQMPVMDGYQATRSIRSKGIQVPIVALTAHAMKGEKERCEAVGCNGYLSKPITANALVDSVSRFARSSSSTLH